MPLYRLLASVFAAFVLLRDLSRGGSRRVRARLGFGNAKDGPHLWLHGASNGELASVRPLLERVMRARPDLRVLVTCNSDTGTALVEGWALPGLTARPAPVDLDHAVRRMFVRWHVVAHVTLESEIWPHRVLSAPGPVILLGGRLNPGTARVWARFPRLARRVFGRFAYVSAQDAESLDRMRALGLPDAACGPTADLKALYHVDGAPAPDAALSSAFQRARTWLAASTHPGEEEIVLAAHRKAREAEPELRLILAPRHPARGDSVEAAIRDAGLLCARRSRGEAPGEAEVYLADTMGEMPLWYRLAGRVFIGGTLTDRGGHTPYEPAAFGAALLHGPDVANFTDPFARLHAAGAAGRITDAGSLASALTALSDPRDQRDAGVRARDALKTGTDADALAKAVLDRLPAP